MGNSCFVVFSHKFIFLYKELDYDLELTSLTLMDFLISQSLIERVCFLANTLFELIQIKHFYS